MIQITPNEPPSSPNPNRKVGKIVLVAVFSIIAVAAAIAASIWIASSISGFSDNRSFFNIRRDTAHDDPDDAVPACAVCGSTDHTVHPDSPVVQPDEPPSCPICGSTDHTEHPVSPVVQPDEPPSCPICGSTDHTEHPVSPVVQPDEPPSCPVCGSTDHTVHPVSPVVQPVQTPTCPVCGSTEHTEHPVSPVVQPVQTPTCPVCGSTGHTVHPKCPICGSTDHTEHPKCSVCGSTDHTVHMVRLYFNANGGSVNTTDITAAYGTTYGTLPTPKRDYYTFDGWFTSPSSGKQVTASSSALSIDQTVYAHWTQNPLSEWVSAAEVPRNAQVVKRMYYYTQTEYCTSALSSLKGWTRYGSESEWSDYGSWSDWGDYAIGASDSCQVETRTVTDVPAHTEYRYGTYLRADNGHHKPCSYTGSGKTDTVLDELWTEWSSEPLAKFAINNYKCPYGCYHHGGRYLSASAAPGSRGGGYYWDSYGSASDEYFWEETRSVPETTRTQYRSRTRSLAYIYYYYRTQEFSSDTYPYGDDISDIREWVRYRAA